MSPYRHYLTRGWSGLRVALDCPERTNAADVTAAELVRAAPFINPCAKGHGPMTVRGGWIVCAKCGTSIGKAPDPNKRK